MLRACFAGLVLCSAVGCTALVDSDVGSLGRRPSVCKSGNQFECSCGQGTSGLQTCNDDGKYSVCRCGPAASGRAGNGG